MTVKVKSPKEQIPHFSPSVPVVVCWNRGKMLSYYLAHHPEFEFQLIKKGHGVYYIEGKTYHFGPRQLVTILPGQIHTYITCAKNIEIEKFVILFQGKWLKNFPQLSDIDKTFPALVSLPDSRFRSMEMIIKHILKENLHRKSGWEEMIRKSLHEFIILITKLKNKVVNPQVENPLFSQLYQYIGSHFTDPRCNVTEIAGKFGYSLNYLSAFFKKAGGVGMKQYLLQCKINAARNILEGNSNLKIESVARQVGYNQYRDFIRVFIKLTGISPATYRKECYMHHKN